jgi:hypothetical protein
MANAAWQMLCVLAPNLVRSFQLRLGAVRRRRSWNRTFDFVFQTRIHRRAQSEGHNSRPLRW